MRVVAGRWGGRRLAAPPGRGTRPTAERVREAVFSILGPLDGVDVIDVFAGSGALGIEALSRGAATALFVERSPRAAATIRANLEALGAGPTARVLVRDWRAALAGEAAAGRRFGLCLLDPPYSLMPRIADRLGPLLAPLLTSGATVVVEHPALHGPVLTELDIATRIERTYGDTAVSVLRRGAAA
jgi:16S rRNA (guanine966-N2)-methyltransferase